MEHGDRYGLGGIKTILKNQPKGEKSFASPLNDARIVLHKPKRASIGIFTIL